MRLNRNDSALVLIDVQEKLTPLIKNQEELLQYCDWIIRLANALNVPIIGSEQYTRGLGETVEPLKSLLPNPITVDKVQFSCLKDDVFKSAWSELKRQQAILIGIETHVCVMQTAFDLKAAGVDVFVVANAVGTRHQIDHDYALQRMRANGIHIVTAEMLFFEWIGQAGTEEFKAMSKQFLQS